MTRDLRVGDRVRHLGSASNRSFRDAVGVGTVVEVQGDWVVVRWDRILQYRRYTRRKLELA